MRLIFIGGLFFGKIWKNMFFKVATAGLGKYRMGGYGRIGVYTVYHKLQSLYSTSRFLVALGQVTQYILRWVHFKYLFHH